ncbi:MAG: hypothetical protein ACSHYB_02720 [Roseibacillus sp.]
MKEGGEAYSPLGGRIFFILVAAIFAGVCYSLVIALLLPAEYVSSGEFQFIEAGNSKSTVEVPLEGTKLSVLTSKENLHEVGRELDLPVKWGRTRESVLAALYAMVEVEAVEGTDLGKVSVTHIDRETAQMVAIAVPTAYVERKRRLREGKLNDEISYLVAHARNREAEVHESLGQLRSEAKALGFSSKKIEEMMETGMFVPSALIGEGEELGADGEVARFQELKTEYEACSERLAVNRALIEEKERELAEIPIQLVFHLVPHLPAGPQGRFELKPILIGGAWGLGWGVLGSVIFFVISRDVRVGPDRQRDGAVDLQLNSDVW